MVDLRFLVVSSWSCHCWPFEFSPSLLRTTLDSGENSIGQDFWEEVSHSDTGILLVENLSLFCEQSKLRR